MIGDYPLWPQIGAAAVVSVCSAIVTLVVKGAAKKLENVATKDFVTSSLLTHGAQLKGEIGEMFVKASSQALVNADVEARIRRVESAFGVKLRGFGEEIKEKNQPKGVQK